MRKINWAAGLLLLVAMAVSAAPEDKDTRVVVPVSVNEVAHGDLVVTLRGPDVLIKKADLEKIGFGGPLWERMVLLANLAGPGPSRTAAGKLISLAALSPIVKFDFDETTLSLKIMTDPRVFAATTVNLATGPPANLERLKPSGAYFNYSVSSSGFHTPSLFTDFGTYVRGGLLYSSVTRTGDNQFIRGLTQYVFDDLPHLRRAVFGDSPVTSDDLGGAAIIGGATVSRNFGLDPYFVRYPSLDMGGLALTPSRVSVYLNGLLVQQRIVPPGPFELQNIPVSAGNGAATVVVRDALGNERVLQRGYYFSTSVLAAGLSEYQYSAGFVRNDSGPGFGDYGDPAFLAFHRIGLTDRLTVGGRFEASRNLVSGGPNVGVATRIGDFGATLALSRAGSDAGYAGEFTYRLLARAGSIGLRYRRFSDQYANLAMNPERDRALSDISGTVGVMVGPSTITGVLSRTRMRDQGTTVGYSVFTSYPLTERLSLSVSGGQTEVQGKRSAEYFAGLTYYFGHNINANVSTGRQAGQNTSSVNIERSVPVGNGLGYRLEEQENGGEKTANADLTYRTSFGSYEYFGDLRRWRNSFITASGGLVYAGGVLVPARSVQDAYALVRVPGLPGVRVYLSNQDIGRTNNRGDFLVPTLLSYYGNQLRIEDRDIPIDYDVGAVERTIAPPYRGGGVVEFSVRKVQTITGSVRIGEGATAFAPSFGELSLERGLQKLTSPLGRQGEFYFENVTPGTYDASVVYEQGTCTFQVVVPASDQRFAKLGTITCKPAK